MLKVEDLIAGYKEKEILHGLDFTIKENSITTILGQSGCGKSTLLKSINRIIEEDGGYVEGNLLLDENDMLKMNKSDLRKKVGLVFQEPIAFPLSVKENLSMVLAYHEDLTRKEIDRKIGEVLKQVHLYEELKGNLNIDGQSLSGGQKHRLAIARSLCVGAKVLMLDEPCSALDMVNTLAIEDLLKELKNELTIIIVTHNLSQAKRIADNILFMDDGNIIEIASKEDFFRSPKKKLAKIQIGLMDDI